MKRFLSLLGLVALAAMYGGLKTPILDLALAQEYEVVPAMTEEEDLECTAADEPLNFPSYWAGPSFAGLDLTGVIRSCYTPEGSGHGVNSVDYLYGECDANRGGCALPIDIQSWPSSVRYKDLYAEEPETKPGTVGGIPAEIWDTGGQVEIFMADVTVVVFGDDPDRVHRFVEALVEGPTILAEVAAYGLVFDSACVSERGYCQADPIQRNSVLEGILIAVVLFLVGPTLALIFRPRPGRSAGPARGLTHRRLSDALLM